MFLLGILFLFGAVVQYNDPDPLRWIAMYLAAGAACFLAAGNRGTWLFPAFVGAIALLWALTFVKAVIPNVGVSEMFAAWEMQNQRVEEGREMYGLLLIAVTMITIAVGRWRST
jgi:hypothetical protein